ncbi:hypothetical protein [Polaribacter atrinae]|uniref:Uncharacterized protein n=1 Tax=Polaribacter atrinae TaxID=1333662 RepID=A0A176T6U8_9FLAO|nr:hypothetical protein [Polaribacter atrinae]OAD43401.1 hypothetical protein LPB303_13110 [Polaribacter atrinae]
MTIKNFLITVFISLFLSSCTEDNDITVPRNLQEYIDVSTNTDLGDVFAYAASASGSTTLTYVYFAPEERATDIRYYEADSLNVDQLDFSNYRRQNLTATNVFDGKLKRFSRSGSEENWCLVTYMLDGELHKSNPIRLKIETNPTSWTDEVTIEFPTTLNPKFTWSDFGVSDNVIYFEAISEVDDDSFVSGVYTLDKTFQYFDTANVESYIDVSESPDDLVEDTEYLFTMMAISDDYWVNTVIEETFVPRNLEEYVTLNDTKTIEKAFAFAASSSGSQSLSYIYYDFFTGSSAMRYYETDNTLVDENDFSNYRRKMLTDEAVYGGELRRYSRTDDAESWCIITYVIDETLHISNPVKIKNQTRPTEWLTDLEITFPETLLPNFTWTDGTYLENVEYLEIITDSDSNFLSGTFTEDKMFQYYDTSNVTSEINTEAPEALILNEDYKITVMGLSDDHWVNLMIQETFTVE